jgi:hypothetical protein
MCLQVLHAFLCGLDDRITHSCLFLPATGEQKHKTENTGDALHVAERFKRTDSARRRGWNAR